MQQKSLTDLFQSPVGELLLGSFNNRLCLCDWAYRKQRTAIDKRIQNGLNAVYKTGKSTILEETKQQLEDYFNLKRTGFELPMIWTGTDFQKRVWQALMDIPYGITKTYLSLSQKMGNEKAIRTVANANGANAISIIVPCHRIVGSRGELVGYAGGLSTKNKLLQLENPIRTQQLTLF